MKDNFDFKSWISENRVGPYSKDNAKQPKKRITEGTQRATYMGMSSTAEEIMSLFKQDIAPSSPNSKVGLKGEKIIVRAGSPEEAEDIDMIARVNYADMLKKVETGNPTNLVYDVLGYQLPDVSHMYNRPNVTEDDTVEEAMDLTPPSPEKIYEPEESEQDLYDRASDVGGMAAKRLIDAMRADGFDDEDIVNFVRTILMDYDVAFSGIDEAMDLTPPSPENIYEPDYESEEQERFLGLGGDKIISNIQFLLDDGYDLEDVINYIRQHFQ